VRRHRLLYRLAIDTTNLKLQLISFWYARSPARF